MQTRLDKFLEVPGHPTYEEIVKNLIESDVDSAVRLLNSVERYSGLNIYEILEIYISKMLKDFSKFKLLLEVLKKINPEKYVNYFEDKFRKLEEKAIKKLEYFLEERSISFKIKDDELLTFKKMRDVKELPLYDYPEYLITFYVFLIKLFEKSEKIEDLREKSIFITREILKLAELIKNDFGFEVLSVIVWKHVFSRTYYITKDPGSLCAKLLRK